MYPEFIAGDTIAIQVPVPSGGTVSLILCGPWGSRSYPASATGTVTIPAADSANWEPGVYKYFVRHTDGGTVTTVDAGTILLDPNPAGGAYPVETKSVNKRILEALIDTLNRRATDDVLERSVDGVTLKYASSAQLTSLIDKYQMRVDAEEGRNILPGSVQLNFR